MGGGDGQRAPRRGRRSPTSRRCRTRRTASPSCSNDCSAYPPIHARKASRRHAARRRGRRLGPRHRGRDRAAAGVGHRCREGGRQAPGPAAAGARRCHVRGRARRRRGGPRRCCATRPRTCWPRPRATCSRASRSRSARRSTTASTTTSSSPSPSREADLARIEDGDAAHPQARARVHAHRGDARRRARPVRRGGRAVQGRADRRPAGRASRSRSTTRTTSPTSAAARTLQTTAPIKAFKLHDAGRRVLARRREHRDAARASTARPVWSQEELDEHLHRIEEAKRRDHRRLGPQLGAVPVPPRVAGRAVLAAEGHGAVQRARTATGASENRRRGYREVRTPIMYDVDAVEELRATGTSTARTCSRSRSTSTSIALKPMNCPAHMPDLRAASAARTATCRCAMHEFGALPSQRGLGRAARADARARASRRTTRTCSSPTDQIDDEMHRVMDFATSLCELFGIGRPARAARRGPRSASATTRCGTAPSTRCRRALEQRGVPYVVNDGRRRLLRPEDRLRT